MNLKLDELDKMIHSLLNDASFSMKYDFGMDERTGNMKFNASSNDNLVQNCGIFNKLLIECKLITFGQGVKINGDDVKIWFNLDFEYKHFDGGTNSMTLATFIFENGKWEICNNKQ